MPRYLEEIDETTEARMEAARRKLADCDSRLAKYRAALDAGADATIVAGWMAEVQGERLRAEIDVGAAAPRERDDRRGRCALVLALHDIAPVLATADPKLKAEVYAELGVSVSYHRARAVSFAWTRPYSHRCANGRVGEGT